MFLRRVTLSHCVNLSTKWWSTLKPAFSVLQENCSCSFSVSLHHKTESRADQLHLWLHNFLSISTSCSVLLIRLTPDCSVKRVYILVYMFSSHSLTRHPFQEKHSRYTQTWPLTFLPTLVWSSSSVLSARNPLSTLPPSTSTWRPIPLPNKVNSPSIFVYLYFLVLCLFVCLGDVKMCGDDNELEMKAVWLVRLYCTLIPAVYICRRVSCLQETKDSILKMTRSHTIVQVGNVWQARVPRWAAVQPPSRGPHMFLSRDLIKGSPNQTSRPPPPELCLKNAN